jgi:hypothetical protein
MVDGKGDACIDVWACVCVGGGGGETEYGILRCRSARGETNNTGEGKAGLTQKGAMGGIWDL